MSKKLGVIVPYRDREEHLAIFKKEITRFLSSRKIPFELIIVNQDNAKLFNRGMLLNIGFKYAEELGCDYVVFHDVDLIPKIADYYYPEYPVHLAGCIKDKETRETKETFDQYFGGVTMFNMDDFRKINGYSNKYWGWGFEDDDLLLRCENAGIPLETGRIKNTKKKTKALFFNGINAYVKCKNVLDIENGATIFISFRPEKIVCDHEKRSDTFTAFSIPGGYNTSISYNSFSRYNFITFDNNNECLYVNSPIRKNYQTNIAVSFDPTNKSVKVYQDGILIGERKDYTQLMEYNSRDYFCLGAGYPEYLESPDYFNGYIDSFIAFSDVLSEEEILKISNGEINKESRVMTVHYDANEIENYELIDLSGNENNGEIINCSIEELDLDEYEYVKIPNRRECVFFSLKHEENGFFANGWKDQNTRWNQLRFLNEVSRNLDLLLNDGLSDLEFVEYGRITENNITTVNIGV